MGPSHFRANVVAGNESDQAFDPDEGGSVDLGETPARDDHTDLGEDGDSSEHSNEDSDRDRETKRPRFNSTSIALTSILPNMSRATRSKQTKFMEENFEGSSSDDEHDFMPELVGISSDEDESDQSVSDDGLDEAETLD